MESVETGVVERSMEGDLEGEGMLARLARLNAFLYTGKLFYKSIGKNSDNASPAFEFIPCLRKTDELSAAQRHSLIPCQNRHTHNVFPIQSPVLDCLQRIFNPLPLPPRPYLRQDLSFDKSKRQRSICPRIP